MRALLDQEENWQKEFEPVSKKLEKAGYTRSDISTGAPEKSLMKTIIPSLPVVAILLIAYYLVGGGPLFGDSSSEGIVVFILLIFGYVIHDMMHAFLWGLFAEHHYGSAKFGISRKKLMSFSYFSGPMKKGQYVLGAILPFLVLGVAVSVFGILYQSTLIFWTGALLTMAGGEDLLVVCKLLMYKSTKSEVLVYDLPTECGVAVFEK